MRRPELIIRLTRRPKAARSAFDSLAKGVTFAALCLCGTAWAYEPETNYALQCMGCHTPDGSGLQGHVPSIRETLLPFAQRTEGRRYLVQVPGARQSSLSDAELATLLNWMIANLSREKAAAFEPFTAQEVTAYRAESLIQVRATRERLLRAKP
jgi:hypothetical protein